MDAPLILFDAVVFDLDGTLVATEGFWVAAAMRGARRAFDELGVERELPTAAQWLGMVGAPLELAFGNVFADLSPAQRARTMQLCVEEEHAALERGGAAPMPDAFEVLETLRAGGVKIGVASNCSQAYLDAVFDRMTDRRRGAPLREFVDEARCLDSARVRNKTDMVRDLLATFGTRSVVMVGDRATDAEAAHANAMPHIHVASGLAPDGEHVVCEATVHGLGRVLEALGRRAQWIESTLRELDALRGGVTVGVTGRCAAGKSTFARDAARVAQARGIAARRIGLDSFLRPSPNSAAAPDDHLSRAFDLGSFEAAVLAPRRAGQPTQAGAWGEPVRPDEALFVDGLFLADPRLRPSFDRLIHLEAPDELLLRRASARDATGAEVVKLRRDYLPAHAAFEARFPPRQHADRVLDASNSLGVPAERA